MRVKVWVGLGILSLGALAPKTSHAAVLDWQAPEACTSDAFVQHLSDNTQRSLGELPLDALMVRVSNETQAGAQSDVWRLTFRLRKTTDTSPPREIVGQSCHDVSRAAAVAVAMALAEEQPPVEPAADEPPRPAPSAPKQPDPTAKDATPVASSQPTPPEHALELWPQASLELIGDTALMGDPTFAGGIGAGLAGRRWDMGVRAAIARSTQLAADAGLGIRLSGYWSEAFGCVSFGETSRPSACLGYTLDVIEGRGAGAGFEVTRDQTAWRSGLHPHLALATPLGARFEVRLRVGAVIGLNQPTFVYDAGAVAHELPRVSFRGALALVWGR